MSEDVPTTSPHVPDHLAGWYAGDLAWARRAHAEHAPPPARTRPAGEEPSHEDAPTEGGRFLAAWYAGDLGSAVRAHHAHEHADDHADEHEQEGVVRLGRTTG